MTEHNNCLLVRRAFFAGVYFLPTTLSTDGLARYLWSMVIKGDVNTRDPLYQAGEPGPLDRLRVIEDFLTAAGYRHVKPPTGPGPRRVRLATDHYFVRKGLSAGAALIDQQRVVFRNCYVDDMNERMVGLCQRVQEQTIGASRPGTRR